MGGKAELPERRKFIIEAMPLRLPLPPAPRPYPYRLEVREFAVSRLYEKDQIVFRRSPEEIREDRWHVWAVRPSQMITDAVEQYLRDAHLFADIRQEFIDTSPDFALTGTVNAIERWDSGDQWYARLVIAMQVVDRANQVIWRREFGQEAQQVYNPDFSLTVEAMRGRLRQYMEQAIPEIDLQIHIRMLQERNQPYEHLLAVDTAAGVAQADTAAAEGTIPGSHPHYEIIPGKLAPDAD
jgi:ABC-type uncharacterized transport system auxiliary subunit